MNIAYIFKWLALRADAAGRTVTVHGGIVAGIICAWSVAKGLLPYKKCKTEDEMRRFRLHESAFQNDDYRV